VGRPIVDLIRERRLPCQLFPVVITGGAADDSYRDGYWYVAKRSLISHLQVLLQSRRLQFVRGIAEAAVLARELQNYRVRVTENANETFDARHGEHDDLVLAVALASWLGERCRKQFWVA
jgi:hypothetical protein